MDATSIKIRAVSRPSNLSRKVITPKPLNLKASAVKLKKKGFTAQPYSLQDEDFDARPFSFLENDPVTPGFDPITPFEITPPHSAGDDEEEDNDNDSVIIDSPGPTADFHNAKIKRGIARDDEIDDSEAERMRLEEAEYVARNLGFSQTQPTSSNIRTVLMKKAGKKASKHSLRHRESRETMFSEDSVFSEESQSTARHKSRFSVSTAHETEYDPTTPFMDTGFDDYFDNSKTPQANTSRNLLLRGTAPPASATRAKFVSTELVMPMPQHPTPLSPTMERFLSRMSEVVTSPLSATFPEETLEIAYDPATPALPPKAEFKIPSHVIDVNLVSVVAMDFSPQTMIDISANVPLVQQECDPIAESKRGDSNVQQIMYIIPILLNDPASFCACDKAHVDSDTASIASLTRSALHPNNILRFENVIVQMRLAPRPRIRRHGWTFLNIGIPTRIVVGILDHLEKEMISVGKCKMVLHGDYYWIYTPVRAFTKIYKREFVASPKSAEAPSRSHSKTPKTVADLDGLDEDDEDDDSVIDDSGDEEEEERETVYKELADSRFYSLLETRSLSVDLYTEIYAKSTADYQFESPSQGDFSLGFSIREIIVTSESNVRGPDWHHVKSQRNKCLARGHPIDMMSPINGLNRSVVGSPFNPGSVNSQAISQWNNNVTNGSIRSASNLGNSIDRWDPNSTPVNRTDPNATPVARSVANGSIVNGAHDYGSITRYGSRGATATPGACSHCGSHVPDPVGSPLSATTLSRFDQRSNSSLSTTYRSQSLNRIREDGRQSSRGHRVPNDTDSPQSRTQSRNAHEVEPRSGSKVRSKSQLSRREKDGRSSAARRREDRSQSRDRTIERDAASTPKAPQTTSTTYDSDNWIVKEKLPLEESSPEKPRKRWGRKKKYSH
ncbi:hypothetical protein H072_2007 [Dactylellina haptotyla CBS 200.50]|uniref:Uncharacterized protein n=1 Tax=Dactylellina haptotyla (strain CBS 200.50) TaxID=1284197 RepID=S8ASM2_DACHA|nr:hypothetical protein H072_2007 [Dactylellina haptotyla CBS 200.50]